MRRKKRNLSVLIVIVTLIIMLLPVSEADAETSASDFRMEGSTLVKYRGTEKNVTIPDTVEVIGRSAFEDNKDVELVVLSNSVRRIDPYAFWGCENLDTVVLGTGLSAVGDYAFTKCTGLEQMTLPSNITAIGIQAFGDCTSLRNISIPAQTTSIHETAFDGCYQLTFHCDSGTVADEYAKAFYEKQQSNLENSIPVTVPDSIDSDHSETEDTETEDTETPSPAELTATEPEATAVPSDPDEVSGSLLGTTYIVGNQAVMIADHAQFNVYEKEQDSGSVGIWEDKIPKYAIIDGKAVADQAYYRSTALGDVVLPQGIQEIGEFAFARSSATSAVLPEGVEHIGYGAFYHCDDLQEVVLPETVRCVEPKAFSHTMWVQNFLESEGAPAEDDFLVTGGVLVAYRGNTADVTVPEGVRVIAGEVFRDHTEIEKVSLPDSLLVVGEGAFEGCSSLSQIVFGENVEEIKDRAFLGNVMSEISIPASVKKAGLQAFGNAIAAYQGQEAEYTYENSATRLSNGIYRGISNTGEAVSGVTVTGLETVFGSATADHFSTGQTSLLEADGSYTLNISQTVDTAGMEAAFKRVFQNAIPDGMLLYELELTDESGIPLKKLGKQILSVVLPVPDAIKGKEPVIFTLDGNGQLERLEAEAVDVDGIEAFRFETNHPSVIGVCGAQNSELPSSENATEPAD